jgi:pyruvate/2-oxoglutarate dehydrogenase complex dihydrolipoamide dehydrogenase (E3) component
VTERFDAVVIGGGMSGLPVAPRAAKYDRVALIEKELLGGTCLNRGCIPTKTMIASAAVAQSARTAATFGVHVSPPTVDLAAVVDRKDEVVNLIRKGSYRAVEKPTGLDFIEGEGRFVDNHTLQVGGTTITADKIFLNTGTRDATGGIEGLDAVPYLTSRTILELRELPEHLIVVGGGFIGCEFAQMFRRFGSAVTVVQRADRLLPAEDPDISAAVAEGFDADGIDVITGTTCTHVAGPPAAIQVGCAGQHADDIVGTHMLIAVGRVPNSDTLGIEHLDIEPNETGFIHVDDKLRAT